MSDISPQPVYVSAKSRRLTIAVIALLAVSLVTAFAVMFHARWLVAAIGLFLVVSLLIVFAFAHALFVLATRRRPKNKVLNALQKIVTDTTILARAIVLGIALTVADLYVAFCQNSFAEISKAIDVAFITAALGFALGLLDFGGEPGKNQHQVWTRMYTAFGYASFFANIAMLAAALVSAEIFNAIVRMFRWPPWILSYNAKFIALDATGLFFSGAGLALLFFFATFYGCMVDERIPHLKDDARMARSGAIMFTLWLLTAPAWVVVMLIERALQ